MMNDIVWDEWKRITEAARILTEAQYAQAYEDAVRLMREKFCFNELTDQEFLKSIKVEPL